jgi:hypothetical protein
LIEEYRCSMLVKWRARKPPASVGGFLARFL